MFNLYIGIYFSFSFWVHNREVSLNLPLPQTLVKRGRGVRKILITSHHNSHSYHMHARVGIHFIPRGEGEGMGDTREATVSVAPPSLPLGEPLPIMSLLLWTYLIYVYG